MPFVHLFWRQLYLVRRGLAQSSAIPDPDPHLCCNGTDLCSEGCRGLECFATLTADALAKRESEDRDNLWGGH